MEKIEKIELKHLCGYLPHGLETNEGKLAGIINWIGWCGAFKDEHGERFVPLTEIKPLILPISALTEPLQNGTVPIIEAAKIAYKWQKWDEKRINKINGVLEGSPYDFWFSEEKKEFMLCNGGGYLPINNQLQIFEYLYSIHADIYGLIPSGLAIDKRTVKL